MVVMSDFGKDCADEWRSIKKTYESTNVGGPGATDKSVREQIVADMNKNIERHDNAPTPKTWPVRTQNENQTLDKCGVDPPRLKAWPLVWAQPKRMHWACCRRCGTPLPGENYPCSNCGLTKEQSYGDVDPRC